MNAIRSEYTVRKYTMATKLEVLYFFFYYSDSLLYVVVEYKSANTDAV